VIGTNIRYDIIQPSTLQHTLDRHILLGTEKKGDIIELGTGIYIGESVKINSSLFIKAGLRFDHFSYRYHNKLKTDENFPGPGTYKARNHVISPKISVHYQPQSTVQYYFSMGRGFHTNDARVVVSEASSQTLPAAYATDFGLIYKPSKNLLIQAALWYIYLQKEYVYAADGGTVDFSGRTRRKGIDVSIRYQPLPHAYVDVDVNYANGRTIDEPKGENYIPLAPVWSSTAGLTIISKTGWNASLRYRYLSKRPANEHYSLVCAGYFVNDLVIKHKSHRFEYGVIVNNLFNVKWKETQYDTESRLRDEQLPENDIAFTAGTKLAAKLTVSYFFGSKLKK
jgi:outer membrane receptor protein involved in Fe transport